MTQHERDDERLSSWIRAVNAQADPALWTRVRVRIEAGEERLSLPGWLGWLMRPVALGAATAAVMLVCGAGLITLRSAAPSGETTASSLTEALLDEVTGTTTDVPAVPAESSPDSGASG